MHEAHPISRGLVLGVELAGDALTRGSARALRDAVRLARHLELPVTLLHSTAHDERWHRDRDAYVHREPLAPAGRAALDAAAASLREVGSPVRLRVSEEQCVVAILREVSESGADLVVVGKRSEDRGDGIRLGSVARSLIHDCPAAVWVARPAGEPSHPRVLAAADLTEVGERVVRAAAQVAPALGAELHVVHALRLPFSVQLEGGDAEARYVEDARDDAERRIRAWLGDTPATLHVGVTSPTEAVLAGARTLEPSLFVMGTVSRGGLPGLVLGNTAERLLDRLDHSLLVVKPR